MNTELDPPGVWAPVLGITPNIKDITSFCHYYPPKILSLWQLWNHIVGTSLEKQLLRLYLPMQGVQFWFPDQELRFHISYGQKTKQNIKQEPYCCNKFNIDSKNGPHPKKKKILSKKLHCGWRIRQVLTLFAKISIVLYTQRDFYIHFITHATTWPQCA